MATWDHPMPTSQSFLRFHFILFLKYCKVYRFIPNEKQFLIDKWMSEMGYRQVYACGELCALWLFIHKK